MPTIESDVEYVGGAIPASGGGGPYVDVDPAPTLLKNHSVSASVSPAVVFDQVPAAGDLIFVVGCLVGPRVVSNPTDGFVIVDQYLAGSHAAVTFAKKATGDETGFSFDVNSSSAFRYHAVSYDGTKLDVDAFLADLAGYTGRDVSNGSSATKVQSSGSVSISEGKGLAIAAFIPDTFDAVNGNFSYTNGYAQEYAGGDAWSGVVVATKALTQSGASDSTFSTDAAGSGDQVVGLLAVIPGVLDAGDTDTPVITLQNGSAIDVNQHAQWVDPGATASDPTAGDISHRIVVTGGVDTSEVGDHFVYYNVADEAGNAADQVTRRVTVKAVLSDPGAAVDGNGDVTGSITSTNDSDDVSVVVVPEGEAIPTGDQIDQGLDANGDAVDPARKGVINVVAASVVATIVFAGLAVGVWRLAFHQSNSSVVVSEPVVVSDTDAPLLTLVGDSGIVLAQGALWVDPGATAYDAESGDLTSAIVVSGSVDSSVVGTYELTYTVSDLVGNEAESVTRIVSVEELRVTRDVAFLDNMRMVSF